MIVCGKTDPQCRGALAEQVREKILTAAVDGPESVMTLGEVVKKAGLDEDGAISFREFFTTVRYVLGLTSAACTDDALRSCFKEIDRSRDGYVGRREVAKFFRTERGGETLRSLDSSLLSCLDPVSRAALRQRQFRHAETVGALWGKIHHALKRAGLSAGVVFDDGRWTPADLVAFLRYRIQITTCVEEDARLLMAHVALHSSSAHHATISAQEIRDFLAAPRPSTGELSPKKQRPRNKKR